MNENLNGIGIDDLQGDQRELAELIGLETYLKLVRIIGGSSIYIAKGDKLEAIIRNRKICEEFDGKNYRHLAAKFSLSERVVRTIINESLPARGKIQETDKKQISLLDLLEE